MGNEMPACPVTANLRDHRRGTPQHRDARNTRVLGAETQMKHHATSSLFNDDITIECCTSGKIDTPRHRGALHTCGLGAETHAPRNTA